MGESELKAILEARTQVESSWDSLGLAQCLVHSRHLINGCCLNE